MTKMSLIKIGMIATLTVLSAACGRGGQVAGRTYVSTGAASGYQAGYYNGGYGTGYGGYGTGYGAGYGAGYNGYGYGGAMGGINSGETVSFDNNMRATYRQSTSAQPVSGTYSFLDSSNSTLQIIPDAGATTLVGVSGPLRFTVSNDGSYINDQLTGAVLYRQ